MSPVGQCLDLERSLKNGGVGSCWCWSWDNAHVCTWGWVCTPACHRQYHHFYYIYIYIYIRKDQLAIWKTRVGSPVRKLGTRGMHTLFWVLHFYCEVSICSHALYLARGEMYIPPSPPGIEPLTFEEVLPLLGEQWFSRSGRPAVSPGNLRNGDYSRLPPQTSWVRNWLR